MKKRGQHRSSLIYYHDSFTINRVVMIDIKKTLYKECTGLKLTQRRSTLPIPCEISTIDLKELNFRIRNGNGCGLLSITVGII